MTPDKIPTARLKSYDAMHNVAGKCAAVDDAPWWCCMAYAAAMAGTTDARLVMSTAIIWLQGWISEAKKANPENPDLELVKQIIETSTDL